MSDKVIKIILVDDHVLFRSGLKSLLEKESCLLITGEVENGRDVLPFLESHEADIITMGVALPELNGIGVTHLILEQHPDVKIIALSRITQHHHIRGMLEAGARGYLLKDAPYEELVTCIKTVAAGYRYISRKISDLIIEDYIRIVRNPAEIQPDILTQREKEVVQLLAEGFTAKDITRKLCVSIKTVETHRKRIMDKLCIHNVAELTKYALREGLTSL